MMAKSTKYYLIFVAIVFAIVGGIFIYQKTNPEFGKKMEEKKTLEAREQEDAITISAEELINEFYNNEVKADDDYMKKWFHLDGKISNIDKKGKSATIRFQNGEFLDFLSVTCYINETTELEKVKSLNTGDRVTVNGKLIRKFLGNLELRQCKL